MSIESYSDFKSIESIFTFLQHLSYLCFRNFQLEVVMDSMLRDKKSPLVAWQL